MKKKKIFPPHLMTRQHNYFIAEALSLALYYYINSIVKLHPTTPFHKENKNKWSAPTKHKRHRKTKAVDTSSNGAVKAYILGWKWNTNMAIEWLSPEQNNFSITNERISLVTNKWGSCSCVMTSCWCYGENWNFTIRYLLHNPDIRGNIIDGLCKGDAMMDCSARDVIMWDLFTCILPATIQHVISLNKHARFSCTSFLDE